MKKVKCANGHFFDAERFVQCPICGEEAAETVVTVVRNESNPDPEKKTKPLSVMPHVVDGHESGLSEQDRDKQTQVQDKGKHAPEISRIMDSKEGNETEKLISQIITEFRSGGKSKTKPEYKTAEIKPASVESEPDFTTKRSNGTSPASLVDELNASESHKISPLPKTVSYYDFKENIEPPVGWIVAIKGPYKGQAFACKTGRNRIGRAADMDICFTEDLKITRKTHTSIIYEPLHRRFFVQAGEGSGLTYVNGEVIFEHINLNPYDKLSIGDSEFIFMPLCGEAFSWDDYMTEGEM